MQEEANEKSINLCITSARMSAEVVSFAMRSWINHTRAASSSKQSKEMHGKQSLKSLTESGAELSQIPIEKSGIADFAREAKKYHVDYAVVKNRSGKSPKYMVFFKAKNSAQLEQAFESYTQRSMKKMALKKERAKEIDHVKDKAKETVKKTVKQVTPKIKRNKDIDERSR